MSMPLEATLSSPFSNLENDDFSPQIPPMDSLILPSMQPLILQAAEETESNLLEDPLKKSPTVSPPTTKRAEKKPKVAEEGTRRRSTRISIAPNRFKPEGRTPKNSVAQTAAPENKSPAIPTIIAAAEKNTPPESIFAAIPTPKTRMVSKINFSKKIGILENVEDVVGTASLGGGLDNVGKEGSLASQNSEGDRFQLVSLKSLKRSRGKVTVKREIGDVSPKEFIEEDNAEFPQPKRNLQKTNTQAGNAKIVLSKINSARPTTKARKSNTIADENNNGDTNAASPVQPAETLTNSLKRSSSEELETEERPVKKSKLKPKRRKSLAVGPSGRKTRSQNAAASTELASASVAPQVPSEPSTLENQDAEIQIPEAVNAETAAPDESVSETVISQDVVFEEVFQPPPRLSASALRTPLRIMVKSATLYYSSLPKNLSDQSAIKHLYRTFCSQDLYQKQLAALGLKGDDKDVREFMEQVWKIVDSGENDDEVVWGILVATWDS